MPNSITIRNNPLLAANTHIRSNTIYGVWSPKDGRTAYAVAESSTIFKWDVEHGVTHYQIPTAVDFYDIFGFTDPLKVIAVGTLGKIFSYDGQSWSEIHSPTQEWLEAIWGHSPDDWYIAGDEGTIWHYKNSTWKKIVFPDKNRLYSACGLEDGTVYIVGSYGTVIKIVNEKAIRIPTGVSSHLLGIVRIPNTQKFLMCGTGGLLFELENDRLTNIPTPYYAHLYGIDAVNTQEILAVGWEGYAAYFDGVNWTRQYLGKNSYMEGVVHIGNGHYLAAGWYGRLMHYNRHTQVWNTIQTGRAERVNDVTIKNDQFVGVTDTGNVMYGSMTQYEQQYCSQTPVDYLVTYDDGAESSVVIAGKSGIFSSFDINTQTLTPLMKLTETLYCLSRFSGGAYFSGDKSTLITYQDGSATSSNNLAKLNSNRIIYALAHLSNKIFYVKEYNGNVSRIDLQNSKIDRPNQPEGGLTILFGDYGYVLGVKDNNIYYVENDTWVFKMNCTSALLSQNEKISTAKVAHPNGIFHAAGSKGTILELNVNDKTNQITVYHSGAYEEVNSIHVMGNRFVAGLNGGRVAMGILSEYQRYFSYISAPTYHVTAALNDDEFCFAGESGIYGFFSPKDRSTISKQSYFGDILCGKKFQNGIILAGCNFIAFIPSDAKNNALFFSIENCIITSVTTDDMALYLGTSNGQVYKADLTTFFRNQRIIPVLQTVASNLASRVIDLTIINPLLLRIVMENGSIIEHILESMPRLNHQSKIKYQFPLQTLYRPISASQSTNSLWIAGYENFLMQVNGVQQSIYYLPEIVYTIALHGPIRNQEYWVGGSSGTLLMLQNQQWYKIHTGIGNKLESGASNSQWFMIGATYGALRFENQTMLSSNQAPKFTADTLADFYNKVFLPHRDRELTATEELPEDEYTSDNLLKHKNFIN